MPEEKDKQAGQEAQVTYHTLAFRFSIVDNVPVAIEMAGVPLNIALWKAMIGYADAEITARYIEGRLKDAAAGLSVPSPDEVARFAELARRGKNP